MYFVNEDIKNCVRVFPEQGRYDYARYDMNENPEGLPQWFVDEVLSEITPEFLATYPEHDQFRKMYAEYIGVKPENVAVTNGSDMAIRFPVLHQCIWHTFHGIYRVPDRLREIPE